MHEENRNLENKLDPTEDQILLELKDLFLNLQSEKNISLRIIMNRIKEIINYDSQTK